MKLRSEKGLTLTELVMASAILTTLTALVWATTTTQTKTFGRESARSMRISDVRVWLERLIRDVRLAGYDPTEQNDETDTPRLFGLQTATPTTLTFTVNVDGDSVLDSGPDENRGYRLNGDTLEQWQGGSTWRPLVNDVQSLTFTYYDIAGAIVNASSPYDSVRDIAEVQVTLVARADDPTSPIAKAPLVTRTARAALRNLH